MSCVIVKGSRNPEQMHQPPAPPGWFPALSSIDSKITRIRKLEVCKGKGLTLDKEVELIPGPESQPVRPDRVQGAPGHPAPGQQAGMSVTCHTLADLCSRSQS